MVCTGGVIREGMRSEESEIRDAVFQGSVRVQLVGENIGTESVISILFF